MADKYEQTEEYKTRLAARFMRDRIWFWKPQWHWFGWRTLIPFSRGGDEYDWHTVVLGWTITGRIIFAVRPCPRTGRCAFPPGSVQP